MQISRIPFALCLFASALALSACRPDYPKCKEDDHCKDRGEVCVEGVCKECSTDAQCREGYVCRQNACVQKPECAADLDCNDGRRCRNQRCVPECTSDRECSRGEKCGALQRCVASNDCSTDADCPADKKCGPAMTCVSATELDADADARRRAELEKCELSRVQFEFNEFGLSDSARTALDRNAECIRFKNLAVTLGGHADERGTEEYNIVLAGKRASSVQRYLVGLGVAERQLKTVSYGEERPLDRASTEDAWAKNRRVEFSPR